MTTKKLPNRIPAEDLHDYTAWVLPPIHGEQDRVLPSAGREAQQKAEEAERSKREKVEDVDYEGNPAGFSAEELQRIADDAEKEGRERGYQTGFEQGRAEGYEAGEQRGWEEMRQKLAAEQQRFQHLVQALRDPLAEQDDALEKLLLDTVCALSQSLVKRELLTDSSHVLDEVRTAVAALPANANNLRIYLNPDDLALVETYAEEQGLDWQFYGDEKLLPGGCRIQTTESLVDYSVEHRLEQQLQAFVNRQLDVDPAEDAEVDVTEMEDSEVEDTEPAVNANPESEIPTGAETRAPEETGRGDSEPPAGEENPGNRRDQPGETDHEY